MLLLLLMCMTLMAPAALTSTVYHVYEEISEVFSGINRIRSAAENGVKCKWPLDIKDCMEKMEAKEGRKMINEAQKKINAMLEESNEMLLNKNAEELLRMKSQEDKWAKLVKATSREMEEAGKEDKQQRKRSVKWTEEKKLEAERLRETPALEKTRRRNMFQRKTETIVNEDKEKMKREVVKKGKKDDERNMLEKVIKLKD